MISQPANSELGAGPLQRSWAGLFGPLLAIVTALAFAGLIAALLTVAALPVFGYRATVITGGSMQPSIGLGALVVSHPVSPDSLHVGDVITFRRPEAATDVTHRIVGIEQVNGASSFTTKGDANASPDPNAIHFTSDVHRAVLTVPYAGYVISFIHSPQGLATLVLLPAIGLGILQVLGMGKGKQAGENAGA
ncbi:MAG: signal peptidase I [Dehalococcoidia bacterium]|nr:signal peptidase I [Dehalococcoidia bacterium]